MVVALKPCFTYLSGWNNSNGISRHVSKPCLLAIVLNIYFILIQVYIVIRLFALSSIAWTWPVSLFWFALKWIRNLHKRHEYYLTIKTYIFIYLVIIIFIIDATVSGHLLALNASISNQSSISASVSILGLFPTFWFLLPWFLIWLSLNLLIKHLWFYDIIFVFKKLLVLIVGSHKVICKWFFVLVRAQRMTFIFIFWNNLIKLNHLWSICWCIIFMGTFMKRLVFIFVFNIIY